MAKLKFRLLSDEEVAEQDRLNELYYEENQQLYRWLAESDDA